MIRLFDIERRMMFRECCQYLTEMPPLTLIFHGFGKCLTDHLHQINRTLVRLVLFRQRLYLLVVQPVSLFIIEKVQRLRKELLVVEIVGKVDILVLGDAHTHKTARTCGVNQRLLLVGGAYQGGIAADQLDGLAVGRTEFYVGRRQQIFQYDLLCVGCLVKLIDIDQGKGGECDVQVELILEVQLVIVVIPQFPG